MANKQRGEVDFDIDGKTLTLRPTFQALCEIEQATGKGILEHCNNVGKAFFMLDAVSIVYYCAKAGNFEAMKDVSLQRFGQIIMDEGKQTQLPFLVAQLLSYGVKGPSASLKKSSEIPSESQETTQ